MLSAKSIISVLRCKLKKKKSLFAGNHVINLFIQYTPYKPSDGSWMDPAYRVSRTDNLSLSV